MKLTAFQSGKGDCLLLETGDGAHRMLIDGGVKASYTEHVAPALGAMRDRAESLDIVYISHIDEDHIAGVLQLLDDEAAWRIHEYHLANGNPNHKPPTSPRPPTVGAIFHNSFHDQIGKNSGAVENMLAATAKILSAADDPWLIEVAQARRDLAASIPQALKVSQRIKDKQLGIALNPQFKRKLMLVNKSIPDIELGSITLKVIGPFPADVTKLRDEWNDWLTRNHATVASIRTRAARDNKLINASDVASVYGPLHAAAEQLGQAELALAAQLGRRSSVTAPNLASLMFLAVEADANGNHAQSVLLTGDGHATDILKGLDRHQALDNAGKLHVTVLKVAHHGSEHNTDQAFCDTVTADNYVFCGNGQHENPDLRVVELIHARRMADPTDQRPFRFWFNSTSTASTDAKARAHMAKVEAKVADLAQHSNGRHTNRFINGSSIQIL